MYLIDTHCHLHDPEFYTPDQAAACLKGARSAGVKKIIVIGTHPKDSLTARDFANSNDNVSWTYGIHPEYAREAPSVPTAAELKNLTLEASKTTTTPISKPATSTSTSTAPASSLAAPKPPVAIGEIGLDYHYSPDTRTEQIRLFEQMLQLASDLSLPVSLHIREAFSDAWPILDNFPNISGVVHSFTGSKHDLRQALSHDFYIGVNGLATYTTTPIPPLEKILLETDAPFLTPAPNRGKMNTPEYISLIAKYLSDQMGVAEELIAEQTTKNAERVFRI